MKHQRRRAFALLLVMAMLVSMLPAMAFAVSAVSFPSAPAGYTSILNYKQSAQGIHDTEYFYDTDSNKWYAYVTNSNAVYSSTNLLTWTRDGDRGTGANGWAPCVIKLTAPVNYQGTDYTYAAYDSQSGFGTRDSSIRLWLSNAPNSGFVSAGVAIASAASDQYDFNAIDPKAFYDKEGKLWMSYGSWFGGIYIVELDPATAKPADGKLPGKRVCYRNINHAAIEGSNVIYNPDTDYYYLNASYGDMDNTYNVRIGRSKNPDGPFLDYNGQDMNNTTVPVSDNYKVGTKITTPYSFEFESGWYSTGHSSFMFDGTDYYISTNARGNEVRGTVMQIRKIYWTADGWPTVGPEMYVPGEGVATGVTADELAGAYQIIPIFRDELEETTAGCRRTNDTIVLAADKTVSGSYQGTWALDGTNLTLTLDGTVYTTQVLAMWDWENWKAALGFTGLSKAGSYNTDAAGIQIWGKQVDATDLVQGSHDALTLPASARTNLVLPSAKYTGVSISWASSNPAVISNTGVLTRPAEGQAAVTVTMTATLSLAGVTMTKDLEVEVQPMIEPSQSAAQADYRFETPSTLLEDSSTHNRDLTAGTAAYTEDGLLGSGAANLSGGTLGLPAALCEMENFTIIGWAKLTGTRNNQPFVSFTGANGESFTWTLKDGNGKMAYTVTDGNETHTIASNAMLSYQDWAQVALTQSGNTVTLYIEGEKAGESNAFTLYPADVKATAGTLGTAAVALDSLTFYNEAKTAAQIKADYDAKVNGSAVAFVSSAMNLAIGAEETLVAHVVRYPNEVVSLYDDMIVYSSSDSAVSVTADGVITGKSAGTASVTATVSNIGSDTMTVTVGAEKPVTGITMAATASTPVGVPVSLNPTVEPADTTGKITWTVDDETVATVSQDGTVTPLKAGSVTITAKSGAVEVSTTLTVTDPLLVRYEFDDNMDDSSSYQRAVSRANGTYEYLSGHSGDSSDKAVSLTTVKSGTGHAIQLQSAILSSSPATFTVSVWVKPTALTAHTAVFFSQGRQRWMSIVPCSVDTGTPTVRICNDGTSRWSDITAPNALNLNEWALLSYTFDNGTVKLYVNGELAAMRNDADNPLNGGASGWGAQSFFIGSNLWDTSFQGGIDDFRIYSTALTASQVRNLYQDKAEASGSYSVKVLHQYGQELIPDVNQSLEGLADGTAFSVKPVAKEGWIFDSYKIEGEATSTGSSVNGVIHGGNVVITCVYTQRSAEVPPIAPGPDPDTGRFVDIKGHWAEDVINEMAEAGYFTGTSDNHFTPNDTLNRATFATVMARICKADLTAYAGQNGGFADVDSGSWYAAAIAWGVENGVVTGHPGGTFDPTGNLTRQEMAAMLRRAAEVLDLDTTVRGDLTVFPDASSISGWAEDDMAYAVGAGLFGGRASGVLDPGGFGTRAEAAAVASRLVKLF